MAKAAGYSVGHVICLLRVADNGLPELEHRYNTPKSEVNWLEAKNPCGICRKFLTIITVEDKEVYSELQKFNVDLEVVRAFAPTHEQITGLLEKLRTIQKENVGL